MAVLKKLKASTLMETMVATVLIVVIFMIASLVMNSLVEAQVKGSNQVVKERIKVLEYKYLSDKIDLPYVETIDDWEISILKQEGSNGAKILFKANQVITKQQFSTSIFAKR